MHNLKYIQSNEMLNSKYTFKYTCDTNIHVIIRSNLRNKKVGNLNAKIYLRNV